MLKHTQISFSLEIHNILQIWQFWKTTIINCWSFHQLSCFFIVFVLSCWSALQFLNLFIFYLCVCVHMYTHMDAHVPISSHMFPVQVIRRLREVGPFLPPCESLGFLLGLEAWQQAPLLKHFISPTASHEFPLTSAKINFCFLFYKLVSKLPKSL